MKVSVEASPVKEQDMKYDEWAVKRAAEDLLRAEEIKQDKKLYALACEHLEKQKQAITSLQALKAKAAKRIKELDYKEEYDMEEEEGFSTPPPD